MAYVYQNINIGNRLDTQPTGKVITTTKGDLITDNGTRSVRFGVGTNNQALVADSTQTTGLIWKTLTPSDINLIAGNGLVLTGDTLDAVGSATIISNANDIEVNSSSVENQVLLSSGTVGSAAIFGAVPLDDNNAVAGILPIVNGGTSASSFTAGNRVIATNVANTALVATSLDPSIIVTTTANQVLDNKTLTTPIITGSINDSNDNEIIILDPVASAVNEITVQNATTTNAPSISASGDDTNIDLNINPKGTGNITLSSIKYPNTDGSTGQVLATNGAGTLSFINVDVLLVGTVQTTDATTTTIPSVNVPTTTDTAYFIEAKFLAKETSPGTNAASFIIKATFNNVAGTLGLLGKDLMYTPLSTLWSADVTISGTDIIFQVTGAASTTISWKVSYNVLTM